MQARYETMHLSQLKKEIKPHGIFMYHTMSKQQIIDLLMKIQNGTLPFEYKLKKMTITELRAIATERGLKGFWKLTKEELKTILFPPENQQKNDSQTSEHEDPQNQNANEVRVQTPKDALEKGAYNMDL